MVVLTVDGQVYQGILVDKDHQRVVLKEATGALRTVPVDSIEEQKAGRLADAQGARQSDDPCRVRRSGPVPVGARQARTVRHPDHADDPAAGACSKAVSAGLTEAVPDAETLRGQVLGAAPDRWTTVYGKVAGALPLDEAVAASGGGKVLYLQGEIDVTAGGTIRISPRYPDGIRFWVDELPAPLGTREFTTSATPGRHAITVRIDTGERHEGELTIQVDKPEDSTAEFTVVGGK